MQGRGLAGIRNWLGDLIEQYRLNHVDKCGCQGEQIADKTIVGNGEDRRFLVLVDCHNKLRFFYTGQVLDRAGDADRCIQLRGNDLARLTNLKVVRHIASINRCTRGLGRSTELVTQRFDNLRVVFT